MTIQIFTRNVYGRDLTFILLPELANTIQGLIGSKTLSSSHLEAFRALGLTFVQVLDPKNN